MKKCVIWMLLVTFSLMLVSCSVEEEPAAEPADPATENSTEETKAPEVPAISARPEATEAQAALEPIPLEIPKAMFIGTPENIEGIENLEKPLGKARPPFLAPAGTVIASAGKPVTASETEPIIGQFSWLVDGDKEASEGSLVEMGPFVQWVQVDLEAEHDIYAVVMWHYHKTPRVYNDVVVQVSNDPEFIEVKTIFNNDHDNSAGLGVGQDKNYVETAEGKLIDAKGVRGRYIRFYSNGNNSNDLNHYIEVEVFGKPAE